MTLLFFNSFLKNFLSLMSWLELVLVQLLLALRDEVMLLREEWMPVIWLFMSFNFNQRLPAESQDYG